MANTLEITQAEWSQVSQPSNVLVIPSQPLPGNPLQPRRVQYIADEYSNFVAIDDLKLNGKLTLGENTADNGGARIALMALENMIADDKSGKAAEKIDGYTPEQRFFLGFGRVWCEKRQPEYSRMLVTVDPHSPGRFRANGVVQNMPEFQKAWGCKAGQPMVKENQCRVW